MSDGRDSRRETIVLLTSYYNAVRSEIIQRLVIRESTLTLFLGASATLAGVALTGTGERRWLLFFIPILGFGASCVYIQHTTAMRALWRYLATEFQQAAVAAVAPDAAPIHWDISLTRAGLRTSSAMRATASMLLIVVPGLVAAIVGLISLKTSAGAIVAFVGSVLAVITSAYLVIYGFVRRPSWHVLPQANGPNEADLET
jgi:hypothetical protein